MKKVWCFLLAVLFAGCLTACASNSASTSSESNPPHGESGIQDGTENVQFGESDTGDSTGTEPSSHDSTEDETLKEESEEEDPMKKNTFYVHIGAETFSATFAENIGAQALKELLAGGDITIQMRDYGGFEKVGPLGQSLPTSNSQTTTQSGDIVLYQGNQVVIFYGSNTWSYTRLGRIDNLSGWEEALGRGDVSVTFSLQE